MKRFLLVVALLLLAAAPASACGPGGFGVSRFSTFGFGGGFGGGFRSQQFSTFSAGPVVGFGGGAFQQNTVIRRGPFGRQVIRQQTFGF